MVYRVRFNVDCAFVFGDVLDEDVYEDMLIGLMSCFWQICCGILRPMKLLSIQLQSYLHAPGKPGLVVESTQPWTHARASCDLQRIGDWRREEYN